LRAHRIGLTNVYLFGSYVCGEPTADSDIDVAVVSDDMSGDVIEDGVRLMRCRRNVDLRIEPHPFRPEDFTPDNPWAAEILQTGIRIV
jgi:predicted nucleotidyltransferase